MGSLCPAHRAPLVWSNCSGKMLQAWARGLPLGGGATWTHAICVPHWHAQCVEERKARGMHGWLWPKVDNNDEDGVWSNKQPPRKAAKALPKQVAEREKTLPWGPQWGGLPRAAEAGEKRGGGGAEPPSAEVNPGPPDAR